MKHEIIIAPAQNGEFDVTPWKRTVILKVARQMLFQI